MDWTRRRAINGVRAAGQSKSVGPLDDEMRRLLLVTRTLSGFLLWTALRSAYNVYLGDANADYWFASQAAFGPAVFVGEALYAFLAAGAVAGIWVRSKLAVPLVLAALAVLTSLLVFQWQQMEADPSRAKAAYAASREAPGLPVPEDRLDTMFSPSSRRLALGVGAVFVFGPLVLLLLRRDDFAPVNGAAE